MKVLFVASESHPFIKTGGLGDVIGALPKSLKDLGVDVRVVLPKYKNIKKEIIEECEYITCFNVRVGWRTQYCGIFKYEYEGVTYYLLDNEYYFKRDGLYGYYDDGEKFAFFDRAALEFLKVIDWQPEVIHCHDWQSGMLPVLHKLEYRRDLFYYDMKTVFSIHNLFYQGNCAPEILPELFGYDYEAYFNKSLEFNGAVSFLKGGLNYSDRISTVSESYAKEIQTGEYGEGFDGLLRQKNNILSGIVNGIDYDEYNPEVDKFIFKNYSVDTLEDKAFNKASLQKQLGLPVKQNVPIIGVVSRLTHQKGCDLIINCIDRLLQKDVQVVILGTGDYLYEQTFKRLQITYPDKVSANILFDVKLSHKIYAASDMFLMPSLFEPCGLGQLIALRYGAVPIVRETGGLKDTIFPYNQYNGLGNGFGFKNYNHQELINTIEYALDVYSDKEAWESIVKQSMESDNSWKKSAQKYKELYSDMIKNNY